MAAPPLRRAAVALAGRAALDGVPGREQLALGVRQQRQVGQPPIRVGDDPLQQHLEVAVSKLKRRFNLEVTLKAPKVPYRETIRGKADAQGKHKKQTGGHGQYGDCKIKVEPLARGAGFEFVNDIFGGAIPKNFIPAVEKGIIDAASKGYLAGYPVVDFRVILYDGSYHEVDSSEIAFKLAGSKGFKKAMEQAKP